MSGNQDADDDVDDDEDDNDYENSDDIETHCPGSLIC